MTNIHEIETAIEHWARRAQRLREELSEAEGQLAAWKRETPSEAE